MTRRHIRLVLIHLWNYKILLNLCIPFWRIFLFIFFAFDARIKQTHTNNVMEIIHQNSPNGMFEGGKAPLNDFLHVKNVD